MLTNLLRPLLESQYFSMEAFGNYQTRHGLTFYSEQGKVKYGRTLMKNNIRSEEHTSELQSR